MRNLGWWLALLAGAAGVQAESYNVVPATLADVLQHARAGDTLVLAAGQYTAPLTGLKDRQTISAGVAGVVLVAKASDPAAVDLGSTTGVTVRGLQVLGGQRGIDAARSTQAHVERCLVGQTATGIVAGRASEIRRCTVLSPMAVGISSAAGAEELVIAECRLEGPRSFQGLDCGISLARTTATAVRGNTVTGFSVGLRLSDNSRDAMVEGNRLSQGPLVVEDSAAITLHANTVSGATTAVELRNTRDCRLLRNWLLDPRFFGAKPAATTSVGLLLADTEAGLCDRNVVSENLFQVCGEAVQATSATGPAKADGPWPILARQQWAANRYDRPDADPTGNLASLAVGQPSGRRLTLATLAAYDRRGAVAPASPGDLGLVAQWLPGGPAVPALVDPTLEIGSVVRGQPLEWRSDGAGCQLVQDADAHSGQTALEVACERAPNGFVAWRGAATPVRTGQRVGAALWLEPNEVRPAVPEGGVLARVVFESATGQVLSTPVVVGPGQTPLLRRGSQPWNDVSAEAVAPEGAAWASLELGLDRAAGGVRFDDLWLAVIEPAPPAFERRPWPVPVAPVTGATVKPGSRPWRPIWAQRETW